MVEIIRGSTETLTLTFTGMTTALPEPSRILVTIESGTYRLEKTGNDLSINEGAVEVAITQAESLRLREGIEAEIQVNFLLPSVGGPDVRIPTDTVKFIVGKQLHPQVMSVD